MASVSTLIDKLKNPVIINVAKSKEHMVYLKRYKNKKMIATTDDGSFGRQGFTTNILEELLKDNKKNKIKIKPISELMPKYQAAMSNLLLSKDKLKAIRKYLFNVESSNNLNATQMQFIIKWIDSQKEETEDGEIWLPNAFAQKEANLILDLKTEEIAGDFLNN